MFRKTLIAEFFTTISFKQAFQSLLLMTLKLPWLRYWNNISWIESNILMYIWNSQSKILSFYNWRSALYHVLKLINISHNDEVIVSWYTCVTVSNAVIQSWAKIIYSDISKSDLWLDIIELEKNINKNTKVIIIQHTFWKPSNIQKIIDLAHAKWILIIEDCAHSLWSRVDNKQTWSFWDFAIFSTWRDKVISSVTWWFLLINNADYFESAEKIRSTLIMPSIILTLKNLNYNIVAYKAFVFYNFFSLWKIIIHISRKLNLITEILTKSEKKCNYLSFNYKLPNSLAQLLEKQFEKIKLISEHRRLIANYYSESIKNPKIETIFKNNWYEKNNYFRFPILLKSEVEKNNLIKYMKYNNILLW
jgi:dTDP-4-amino-4,6-dideoxygalactose transaminase